MSWITLTSVTATNGQKTVAVNSGSTATIKIGDALKIGAFDIYEIEGVFANQLTLRDAWAHATQTNAKAVVVPTFGDFNAAVTAMRELTDVAVNNLSVIEDWGTKSGNVTFQGKDGQSHDARTMQQMDADVAELEAQASNLIINVSGRGFARSEADMLAMRAANATKFAASGMIHAGKTGGISGSDYATINEGLYTQHNASNRLRMGRRQLDGYGSSETPYPVFNLAGFPVRFELFHDYAGQATYLKFPDAPDGTVTYDSATGAVVKHPDAATAFASETATNKVLTERVDMFGLEMNLQTINDAQPFFAPYGCAQSQSTTVDGIATEVDNINPISYFAAYPGDTTSLGRGWNVTKLSEAQKEKLFANPEHNVFRMNNGELKYTKVVQKTIPGAGNGDWENVNPATGNPLRFDANTPVLSPAGQPYVASKQWRGVFEDGTGYYFYVLGSVLRLNQGAYHPSFNPLGARYFVHTTSGGSWNSANVIHPVNTYDCFISRGAEGSHTEAGYYDNSGFIGSAGSGRPDGRFYDGIYPDSVGGVIDRRLSAFPITMEDYLKATAKAENGTMRGMEKLVWTEARSCSGASPSNSLFVNVDNDAQGWVSGYSPANGESLTQSIPINKSAKVYAIKDGQVVAIGFSIGSADLYVNNAWYLPINWLGGLKPASSITLDDTCYLVFTYEANLSVSGNFLQTDVIGHPANILQTDALKDGWMGSWIPQIPDGTTPWNEFIATRSRRDGGDLVKLQTDNNGQAWTSAGYAWNAVTNSPVATSMPLSSRVEIWNYTAAAKVTKPSAVLPVYGSKSGLGPVITTEHNAAINGALLGESLMGKVLTASSVNTGLYAIPLSLLRLDPATGKLAGYDQPKHGAIPLAAPNNNSPAIKILPHAVSNNGQATLGFVWNELKHNGANWGDDGAMRVIDSSGTYNNLNGQSCLYGYAELALPIGWVDNHARFGAQVQGVDL